jgi:hypothetical protein
MGDVARSASDLPSLLDRRRGEAAVPDAVLDVALGLEKLELHYEISRNEAVISCREAARVRGIPLEQELHSRVLSLRPRSRRHCVIVHFAAHRGVDDAALQQVLRLPSRPRGASERQLGQLGFDRGTVNPFVHLSRADVTHLFDAVTVQSPGADFPGMMTNAGHLEWSIRFSLPGLVTSLRRAFPGHPPQVVGGIAPERGAGT